MALVSLSTRTALQGQFEVLAHLLFPVDSVNEARYMPGVEANQTSNQLLSLPIRVSIGVYSILLIGLSLERRAIGQPVVRESLSRTRRNPKDYDMGRLQVL
ncbi:hypothetical protein ASPFODRAFT_707676 [Aspergillus luchuensis CBS 106.47]|uniref:Uncharacterized protein n=1 Tax=Aspergillus luchuensis (strain CBS 106.47) TaxID=1137211 RepID=A0A1M3T0Y1_ASPLC|nr:hypothetical protein ASPFODRAFT_707676 [Aspergillus luchuensis CBS 106.47]